MRCMGLDLGDKWIGVALSDPVGILATPLTIISSTSDLADIQAIMDIVREKEVETIIVGLPISMNGTVGQQAEKVKVFTEKLKEHAGVPVEFRDERLSSVNADRLMRESNKKKRVSRNDAVAAALILQSYLEEFLAPGD